MDTLGYLFLILSAISAVVTNIIGFIGRNREVSLLEDFWAGSFVYRNVPKYIKRNFITPFMIFSYMGVGWGLVFVLYILFKYLVL